MNKVKVLFVSSEVYPFAKVGGLADVVGALPIELQNHHCDARVIMPLYKSMVEHARCERVVRMLLREGHRPRDELVESRCVDAPAESVQGVGIVVCRKQRVGFLLHSFLFSVLATAACRQYRGHYHYCDCSSHHRFSLQPHTTAVALCGVISTSCVLPLRGCLRK